MDITYTSNLETEIWNMAEELDESEDFSKVIDFLNSKEGFQPFGKRLAEFIDKKYDLGSTDRKTMVQALNEACEKNGVGLSEIASNGTLRNWFDKDKRPKKGEDSRFSMFALAFALRLSVEETKDLFHKIFLDRAFNYRNEKEVIYYFCLKNNKTWADAKRMIAKVENMTIDTSDHTQLTNVIVDNINAMSDENILLEYIRENGHNFEKNSVTAKEKFSYYLEQAKKLAKEEVNVIRKDEEDMLVDEYGNEKRGKKSYSGKWINSFSNNFLYEIITGIGVEGDKGTKTVFKNATLPKEIKQRFPEAITFGKEDMKSEEYRKVIVLLFSYCFWYKVQYLSIDFDYDDYIGELDHILFSCNFSKLYPGNPFDWLFLFCSQDDCPLAVFRGILSEVLPDE